MPFFCGLTQGGGGQDPVSYSFGPAAFDFGTRVAIMGILNVTPDSFSDGGSFSDAGRAVDHGLRLARDGADIIDVGGESTRPGAEPVDPGLELERVVPVIRGLSGKTPIPISVDTRNAAVAAAALDAGACIVNDVSGLRHDVRMADVIGSRGATAVIMHMRGTPETMQADPVYTDLIGEISEYFRSGIRIAADSGIAQIILDPGIGFGKSVEHNLEILGRLGEFSALGRPVMVGPSRKSFIGTLLGLGVGDRLEGTIGASVAAVMNGAAILRVHDVLQVARAVRVA
jgi:dihydropteroate synthase